MAFWPTAPAPPPAPTSAGEDPVSAAGSSLQTDLPVDGCSWMTDEAALFPPPLAGRYDMFAVRWHQAPPLRRPLCLSRCEKCFSSRNGGRFSAKMQPNTFRATRKGDGCPGRPCQMPGNPQRRPPELTTRRKQNPDNESAGGSGNGSAVSGEHCRPDSREGCSILAGVVP